MLQMLKMFYDNDISLLAGTDGGKKIPEFMRGLGKGMREFNDAKDKVKNELNESINAKDKATPTESK